MSVFLVEANKAIKESGGRMTEQRRLVIELLEASAHPIDAEGLYILAHEEDASISLATVYRTLNTLEEAGLVQQRYISREHDRKYYEMVISEKEYHFTCRECRTVIPFRSDLIREIKQTIEAKFDVQVFHACICFDGLCAACREKKENTHA